MNLIVVPFHDWRKIILEGSRTRDAHFIKEMCKESGVIQVIVNRPTTLLEIWLKRKPDLIEGELLISQGAFKFYRLEKNLYLTDFVSYDVIGQLFLGYKWFIKKYGDKNYLEFIKKATDSIGTPDEFSLLIQNVFAYQVTNLPGMDYRVFDAWDNFLKFKVYRKIRNHIHLAYQSLAENCDRWITNSRDNIEYFNREFGRLDIEWIANGVDLDHFGQSTASVNIPDDLIGIEKPIVGFGGKISHLIDTELLNRTMEMTPEASFVFVGQILDKDVFNQIKKLPNFHYLGDKHYSMYPRYVKNFDICIVPYVIKREMRSGANSIKVYEYLAANKKVIGTNANGLEDLTEYLYVINSAEEFSMEIVNNISQKNTFNASQHSWKYKTNQLLRLFSTGIK